MLKTLTTRLLANKFLLTAVSISILILLLILIFGSRTSSPALTSTPQEQSSTTNPFSEFTNLTEEKVNNAVKYRTLIEDRLPIYLPNLKTSVGIDTTISITLHPTEPSLTRLSITGLSYLNKNELDPKANPNISAFEESFLKAKQLLTEAGIEPKQLLFDYGQADYVGVTANYWVDQLKLLK